MIDDKFETVFNEGRSNEEVDRICDNLFEGNRECYAEEEYNQDGVLVYEPSPLDEMWVPEPEKRDQLDSLARQRRLTERRQNLKSCDVRKMEVKGKGIRIEHSWSELCDFRTTTINMRILQSMHLKDH